MKRGFLLWQFLILLAGYSYTCGAENAVHIYTNTYKACNACSIETGNALFYDDGGADGNVSNQYSITVFRARPGFNLSLYFTQIDLPHGAKIKVYNGIGVDANKLEQTFTGIIKTKNIVGEALTIEYIPAENSNGSKGWEAHLDEIIPKKKDATVQKVMSPPESDCPYAIPLCQNNTVIALAGQYDDLGAVYDDEGSCYAGTGSGGSVWYSFTPQANGLLDFTINPQGTTDYDFVLWDITNGCQSNKRVELACNYSLYTGGTGMSSVYCNENVGSCSSNDCSNQSKYSDCNRFNNRVNVSTTKQYAICINFYSGSNDGFILTFKNEASSVPITDNTPPTIKNAYSGNCTAASSFHVIFSEWVDCSTIQGTDFTLAGHTFSIVNTNCVNGRTNNIDITVSPALAPGTYTVNAQNILDLCGNNMNSNYNIVLSGAPNPSISAPQLVCKAPNGAGGFSYQPGSQVLTASGGTSYYWFDGQTGPTATYSATAPKTVTVTVVSGACSATASTTINVENIAVNLGPDLLYCGTPLALTALPNIGGSNYTFYRNPTVIPPSNGTQLQTGSSNVYMATPAANSVYRVVVTSPNGCKAFDDVIVVANPPVNAQITNPGTNFCSGSNPVALDAFPPGGTFSGPGVANDTFYPNIAGVGTHTISYTVTNACGTFSNTRNIRVIAGTVPTMDLAPTYCSSVTVVRLNPQPGCGTLAIVTGPPSSVIQGICNIFNNTWPTKPVFSPSTAGIGLHQLIYTPNGGCANTFYTNVIGPGVAPIINGAGGPYCVSSGPVKLSANPRGGTWSGPGMTDSIFSPSAAGVGTHTITYTVFACGDVLTSTAQIQVVAAGGSATISYGGSPYCSSLATAQAVTQTGTSGGTYSAPGGLSINSTTGAITPSTSTPGTYTVTYTIPAGGGCPGSSTTTSVTISSGILPTFNAIGPLCQSSTAPTLPASSTNGTPINGSWSPSTINTSTAGTSIYTFTPNVGQCATTATMNITITAKANPAFAAIGPLCQNSAAPALPTTSTNSIPGSWSPSTVNTSSSGTTTYTFTPNVGQCANTATMNITVNAQSNPNFTAIGPLCQNSAAPTLPTTSTNSIPGTWSPSTVNTSSSGTSTYTFTPNVGQCATTATMNITVNAQSNPNFTAIGPLCQNSAAPTLPSTSTNSINGTWSPSTINTSTTGTSTYTFTPNIGQCATGTTMDITVSSQINPNFTAIGPLCQNSVAPTLPSSSTNSINGTWSPSIINTSASGTSTYTFTPNIGQCAASTSMDITVDPQINPNFTAIGPLCQNSTAPTLPVTSTNSINGSWSPSTVNTATSGTSLYTFTPNIGQCAGTATMNITIDPQLNPNFTAIGPLCQNSAAPTLPSSSTNSVNGSWSPATVNTSANGTSTYTFTPNSGQCATTSTMDITIDAPVLPNFSSIGPLCQNSTAPTLPASSTNSIPGSWSPSTINTSTTGSSTYTFTPNVGQCATGTTMDIIVSSQINPNFTAIGPLCQNSVAPTLPSSSTNSINGTWSPSIINTSVSGTSTYTFTPDIGQCAASTSMDITVDPQINPNFTAIGPLCQNSAAPTLPVTSTNSINGSWSPSTVNTATSGTSLYTFTPNIGQCAGTATMNITIDPQLNPNFTAIGPLCQNSAAPTLPTTSTNSIPGTWSPSAINTTASGTSTYTFTPNSGQCATTSTMDVTIDAPVLPDFSAIGPLCQNSVAPTLPASSTNSIPGSWSPSTINTSSSGTSTYTFTPNIGQCATGTTIDITVSSQINPNFTSIGPLCQNSVAPTLPSSSTNSINGTWSPSIINTSASGTSTYTFTPDIGQCAASTSMDITISTQINPVFTAIGPLCENSVAPGLPSTSTNSINGSWSPSVINTTASGTTTYTFTANSGQCATGTTLDITVDLKLDPSFNTIGPLCQNSTAPTLPSSSTNSINGTWSPSTINTTSSGTSTYTFSPDVGQCANTSTMDISIDPQLNPNFTAIGPLCQNSAAPTLPSSSTNSVNGSWSPSTINTSTSGTTTFTFSPDVGQCAIGTTMDITVDPQINPNFSAIGPLCQNSTAPTLPATSTNSINGSWNPSTVNTAASGTSTYTFTPNSGQCATGTTMDITVSTQINPNFTTIGPLCQNSTAPTLSSTSTNSINGSWSPSTINTSTSGTSTYTFSPDVGQCAIGTTMDITVDPQLNPNFTAIGPLCQNSTAPTLPSSSTNSVNGSWSPSTINTSTSGTTTYTFSPDVGQCAIGTTMDITVDPQVNPNFSAIGPLCQNSTAPTLPATSTNSINGSWNPSTVNTAASGTSTYTFTPNSGQCATGTTMDITVSTQINPNFSAIGPLCQNSTAPTLSSTSTNSINGSWSPSTINTSTSGTSTYTFSPDVGQCAIGTTMDITVDPQLNPNFSAIGPLCQNSTAPTLPLSSTNSVNGSWSPSTINTSTSGTTTFTFSPDLGQCAIGTTMDITVDPQINPNFSAIGPLCQNSTAPTLPATSTNSVNGTWSPSTINTATNGTSTYTFTPNSGQCATITTMDIDVTLQILTAFTQIGPLCQNSTPPTIPSTSDNGVNGSWSPSAINTSTSGTVNYIFTPSGGQCATNASMDITVDPQISPAFNSIGPLCQNTSAPNLPSTSNNSIPGSWSPSAINTSISGSSAYTFTPNSGQCATNASMSVIVDPVKTTALNQSICQGQSVSVGSQVFNSTGNYSVNLLTSKGCDSIVNLDLTVNPLPTVGVSSPTICSGSTATITANGAQTYTWSNGLPNGTTVITPVLSGSTSYVVTGTDNKGCSNTATSSVTVNPTKTTALNQTICQGENVTVGGQTFSATGNYSVRLQTSLGCDSTINLSLIVNPVKTTDLRQTICEGQTVVIGGQTFPNSGTYTVKLQTTLGCDSVVNLDLTVKPQLLVDVDVAASSNDICQNEKVTFTASPVNGGTAPVYQWYLNGNLVGTNSNTYSNSNLNDDDSVWVQLVSSENCVRINPAVSEKVLMNVSTLNYTKPSITYCSGDTRLIDLQIPQTNYTITWQNEGITTNTSGLDELQVSNTVPGAVDFAIHFGNNCLIQDSVTLHVNSNPDIDAISDKVLVKYGVEVQLDAISGTSNLAYNWLTTGILSNTDIKNPTSVISSPTWYEVLVTDANGCRNRDSVFVDMIDECSDDFVFVPNAFTPNRDGTNDCFGVLYAPPMTEYKMVIFNRWGEKVFESKNINDCWDGTYKNTDALMDSYSFVVGFRCYNGKVITKKGIITLLR